MHHERQQTGERRDDHGRHYCPAHLSFPLQTTSPNPAANEPRSRMLLISNEAAPPPLTAAVGLGWSESVSGATTEDEVAGAVEVVGGADEVAGATDEVVAAMEVVVGLGLEVVAGTVDETGRGDVSGSVPLKATKRWMSRLTGRARRRGRRRGLGSGLWLLRGGRDDRRGVRRVGRRLCGQIKRNE